jgi:hypothetical protein
LGPVSIQDRSLEKAGAAPAKAAGGAIVIYAMVI